MFSQCPFREVDDEHLPFIHQPPKLEEIFPLTDDVSHQWRHREFPDLVLNRRDDLFPKTGTVSRILLRPESAHDRIVETRDDLAAKYVVDQDPRDIKERRSWGFEKREDGVLDEVLRARPPRLSPEPFENGNE